MAQQTKVGLIGRRVTVQVTGLIVDPDTGEIFEDADRSMLGRAERVEEDRPRIVEEASAMDEPGTHHEFIKEDWTLTIVEFRQVAPIPFDDNQGITYNVPADDGSDSGSITANNPLEDLMDAFDYAKVIVLSPFRGRTYWGLIERQSMPQDRNVSRGTMTLRRISLGFNPNTEGDIPNPLIQDASTLLGSGGGTASAGTAGAQGTGPQIRPGSRKLFGSRR